MLNVVAIIGRLRVTRSFVRLRPAKALPRSVSLATADAAMPTARARRTGSTFPGIAAAMAEQWGSL